MKSVKAVVITSLSLSALALSGCSTVKSYFPDKEKDYQFERDIPLLIIPADLAHNEVAKRKIYQEVEPEPENIFVIADEPKFLAPDSDTEIAELEPEPLLLEENSQKPEITLAQNASGVMQLGINQRFDVAWRMISKALTRNMLEITARNQTDKFFRVQYDEKSTGFKDDTILDELDFIFGDTHTQEKPYRIQLLSTEEQTHVIILDELETPLSTGAGLKLLKLLHQSIQTDLSAKK